MSTKPEKASVCVYFLRDPRDNQPRYVGITDKPKKRLYGHVYCNSTVGANRDYSYSRPGIQQRHLWFAELHSIGLQPLMDVFLSGLTRDQAKRVEHYIISQWMVNRPGQLVQPPSGLFDPMNTLKELWQKSHARQRIAMKQFIDSQSLVSVAS